ncbi:hypothetical protein PAMA_006534 [Pampus argenteus]
MCAHPELGPWFQTITQHATGDKPVHSEDVRPVIVKAAPSPNEADVVVDRRVYLDKQLYRGAKPELRRERGECVLHQEDPYTHKLEYESFSNNSEETDTEPGTSGGQTQYTSNMARSDMALLAELSSITCSPTQHQEKLHSVSVSGRVLPCNSTPHSADGHQCLMTAFIEDKLPDSIYSDMIFTMPRENTAKVPLIHSHKCVFLQMSLD